MSFLKILQVTRKLEKIISFQTNTQMTTSTKIQSDIVFLVEQIVSSELEQNSKIDTHIVGVILQNLTDRLKNCVDEIFKKYEFPSEIQEKSENQCLCNSINSINTRSYQKKHISKPASASRIGTRIQQSNEIVDLLSSDDEIEESDDLMRRGLMAGLKTKKSKIEAISSEKDSQTPQKRKLDTISDVQITKASKQVPPMFKTVKNSQNSLNTDQSSIDGSEEAPSDKLKTKLQVIPCIDCRNDRSIRYHANTLPKEELDNWYQSKFSIMNPCPHVNKKVKVSDKEYRRLTNLMTEKVKTEHKERCKEFFRAAVGTLMARKSLGITSDTEKIENGAGIDDSEVDGFTDTNERDIEFKDLNNQLKTHQWWRVFVDDNESVSDMKANDIESVLKSKAIISW